MGREAELQQEVERVRRSLVSIQGLLEEKTTSSMSQQEQGLKYITECERLSKELSQMSSERDSAVTQGKARLQEAQDLRREVSSIIEKKLSMLVRDKDLEIESLSARNKSLLEVIDNEKGVDREKEENGKEAKLLEEIRKLKDENIKDKDSVENSNELLYLKGRITELEKKLNSEALEKVADNSHTSFDESNSHQEEVDVGDRSLVLRLETKSMQLESVEKQAVLIGQELSEVRSNLCKKEEEQSKLKEEASRSKAREAELQQEVERVRRSLVSIQGLLEEKTTSNVSQQEQGLRYITECERLSKELSQMSSERDSAVTQGKARLQEAQDLRR